MAPTLWAITAMMKKSWSDSGNCLAFIGRFSAFSIRCGPLTTLKSQDRSGYRPPYDERSYANEYKHALPKSKKVLNGRMNLTYRFIME